MRTTIRLDFDVESIGDSGDVPTAEGLANLFQNEIDNWDDIDYRVNSIQYASFQLEQYEQANANQQDTIALLKAQKSELQDKYDQSLKDWVVTNQERRDALRELGQVKGRLLTASGSFADNAIMVAKIHAALTEAGYDLGWGNDTDLDELETALGGIRCYVDDASSEVSIVERKLDEIRTGR